MQLLDPYTKKDKKTVRTNIDGNFTVKIDKNVELKKGMLVEISGQHEIYKVNESISPIPNNPSYDYYLKRNYDEYAEFSMVKCVDLSELTLFAKQMNAMLADETFNENEYKENYTIFGIGLQYDGRLNKNQMVRLEEQVIVITELVKPKEKGGPIEIKGEPVERLKVDSVHPVRIKENGQIETLAEYSEYGDALLMQSRYNKNQKDELAFL